MFMTTMLMKEIGGGVRVTVAEGVGVGAVVPETVIDGVIVGVIEDVGVTVGTG